MFSFEQIKDLIELVASRRLQGIEVTSGDFRLKIDGHGEVLLDPGAAAPVQRASEPAATSLAQPTVEEEREADALPPGAHVISSPIVGTFYAAPSPDSPTYVQVGDRVKAGQVLCIVEAMKLMNEIESDVDGEILEILPKNAQPVEFGEPLFALRAR